MKNFIKKNLWSLIVLLVAIVLLVLGTVSVFCVFISCILFGVVCIFYASKLRKKYKKEEDISPDEIFYDATKYDYDEGVYYIGPETNKYKIQSKNFVSRISTFAPAIALYLLGFGLFAISLASLIRSFF